MTDFRQLRLGTDAAKYQFLKEKGSVVFMCYGDVVKPTQEDVQRNIYHMDDLPLSTEGLDQGLNMAGDLIQMFGEPAGIIYGPYIRTTQFADHLKNFLRIWNNARQESKNIQPSSSTTSKSSLTSSVTSKKKENDSKKHTNGKKSDKKDDDVNDNDKVDDIVHDEKMEGAEADKDQFDLNHLLSELEANDQVTNTQADLKSPKKDTSQKDQDESWVRNTAELARKKLFGHEMAPVMVCDPLLSAWRTPSEQQTGVLMLSKATARFNPPFAEDRTEFEQRVHHLLNMYQGSSLKVLTAAAHAYYTHQQIIQSQQQQQQVNLQERVEEGLKSKLVDYMQAIACKGPIWIVTHPNVVREVARQCGVDSVMSRNTWIHPGSLLRSWTPLPASLPFKKNERSKLKHQVESVNNDDDDDEYVDHDDQNDARHYPTQKYRNNKKQQQRHHRRSKSNDPLTEETVYYTSSLVHDQRRSNQSNNQQDDPHTLQPSMTYPREPMPTYPSESQQYTPQDNMQGRNGPRDASYKYPSTSMVHDRAYPHITNPEENYATTPSVLRGGNEYRPAKTPSPPMVQPYTQPSWPQDQYETHPRKEYGYSPQNEYNEQYSTEYPRQQYNDYIPNDQDQYEPEYRGSAPLSNQPPASESTFMDRFKQTLVYFTGDE